MAEYKITRENMLDLIHSFGLKMKEMTNPHAHPYDDERRAKPYEKLYREAQQAWKDLSSGQDELEVVRRLLKIVHGPESNAIRLLELALLGLFEAALLGKFETANPFDQLKRGHHWITYRGDFYSLSTGDRLNVPRVERIANENLPKDKRKLEGAKEIASMMPNPCTRIKCDIQVR